MVKLNDNTAYQAHCSTNARHNVGKAEQEQLINLIQVFSVMAGRRTVFETCWLYTHSVHGEETLLLDLIWLKAVITCITTHCAREGKTSGADFSQQVDSTHSIYDLYRWGSPQSTNACNKHIEIRLNNCQELSIGIAVIPGLYLYFIRMAEFHIIRFDPTSLYLKNVNKTNFWCSTRKKSLIAARLPLCYISLYFHYNF